MPDLTNLTNEECIFLFEVLKREESRGRLPVGDVPESNASADNNQRQKTLKDLLWRLQVVCSLPTEFDNKELASQRLEGYC